MTAAAATSVARDRETEILDAALAVLASSGIGGVSMRAVARQAGVSLGLANYYFTDKTSLVCAALRSIGEQDLAIVRPDPHTDPAERLRQALRRVADDEFLQPHYLALRLQLWSLAAIDAVYAEINRNAQRRYLAELAELIVNAVPGIGRDEAMRRASDILVIQNGIWLTTAIITDSDARARGTARCEEIAFAHRPRATTRK